jgi:hypothetical protein
MQLKFWLNQLNMNAFVEYLIKLAVWNISGVFGYFMLYTMILIQSELFVIDNF